MRVLSALILVISSLFIPSVAFSCEQFVSLSNDDMKEARGVLKNPEADALDRMFAFELLACSDNPNIRNYAIKEGLSSQADPLIRNQVLLKAMMQKQRVSIELNTIKTLSTMDKKFIEKNAGVYSKNVTYRSEKDGCLSLHKKKSCDASSSIFIKGDIVEYNFGKVVGEFRLSKTGQLIGTLRPQDNGMYTQIPAVIKLF